MTAQQYAYPAPRTGWRTFAPSGLARGTWRITHESGDSWKTFQVLPGFHFPNGPRFTSLAAAQDHIEGLESVDE